MVQKIPKIPSTRRAGDIAEFHPLNFTRLLPNAKSEKPKTQLVYSSQIWWRSFVTSNQQGQQKNVRGRKRHVVETWLWSCMSQYFLSWPTYPSIELFVESISASEGRVVIKWGHAERKSRQLKPPPPHLEPCSLSFSQECKLKLKVSFEFS